MENTRSLHETILHSMQDGVVINVDKKIVFVNSKLSDMTGYTEKELLEKTVIDITAPEYRELINERTEQRQNGISMPPKYDIEMLRKNGEHLPVEINVSLITFNGKSASLTLVRDISQRVELETEHSYQTEIIKQIPVAVIQTNLDYKITEWNKGAELTYGWKREEVLGRTVNDVLKTIYNTSNRKEILQAFQKQGFWEGEISQKHRNGKTLFIGSTVSVIKEGNKTGVVAVNKNITDMKQVVKDREHYQQKLRTLFNNSSSLEMASTQEEIVEITRRAVRSWMEGYVVDLIFIDNQNLVDLVNSPNRYFTNIQGKGITARAARTMKTQLVNDVSLDPDYLKGINRARTSSELAVPIIVRDEALAIINVESTFKNAFTDEDKEILETFSRSVSNAVERITRMDYLERTVEERASELSKAYTQLKELDKAKDHFISLAAHELRTPLTSILGYMELVFAQKLELSKDQTEYCNIIQKNLEKLISITDDLLDHQRLSTGQLTLRKETHNIIEIVDHVEKTMEPMIAQKEQKFEIINDTDSPMVYVDQIRISQVLNNIIANSSKFSPNNSTIRIKISNKNDNIVCSITDQGIGIKPKDMDKMFKPFPKIDKDYMYTGTGMGLSLSKGIIELHGGEIWVESKGENMGATFFFTIPNKKPE